MKQCFQVHCSAAHEKHDVALVPLGVLACTLRDAYGAPIPNVQVALRSQDLGEDVERWVAEHRVPAPTAGLRTDADGRLRLEGLPQGDYTWRARAPAGGEREGLVHVRGRTESALEVAMP